MPRLPVLAVAVVVGSMLAAGCGGGSNGRDELEAETARFTYGGRTARVPLDECGREGDIVVLAGTADGLVVQVSADLGEGGSARTGVTGDMGGDDGIWGAFGDELGPRPAGEITRVAVDGDRLTVEGRWARLDDDLQPDPDQPLVDGKLVARCPETADDTA